MAQPWGAAVGPPALVAHNPLPKGAKDVLPKYKGDGKVSVEEHLSSFNVAIGILAVQYEDVAIRLFVQTLTEGAAEWFSQLQVPLIGQVKDIQAVLAACPNKRVRLTILVADIPMSYGMLLSRTFCKDLGGEIKMDWFEAVIPLGNQKIKLEPEPKNQTDQFQDLSAVLQRCHEHRISLNPKKSVFCITEGKLLGHIVSKEGFKIDPERVNVIQRLSLPSIRTGVRSLFGQVNFLRRFVPKFAETTKHIVGLLSEQHPFKWTEEAKNAFEKIKESVANAPTLVNPDFTKDFILYCYALDHTMSGILLQLDERGAEMPIAFNREKHFDSVGGWTK
ncbi:uncharacterized protein LOC131876637 [Cryptomeria japonica]|uniref:uncharacterized protein LOC131876637 n=1 Tax=Cryptomeria japonica TaxID=3369 RepID=UPI0027D9F6F9|nr:uncharacterized protein LOC131876637 [Cryptomeria japonica]